MKTPFAITLDVGSSLLNKTGSWGTECPCGAIKMVPEDIQGGTTQ